MADTLNHLPEPQKGEDLYRYLLERVTNLEDRNTELREQLRQIEADKRYLETQKVRYEREVRKFKGEIEQMKSPPLVIGTVTDLIDENRVIVRSSAGPRFLVGISQSLNIEEIKPGARCTLNQQSLAIVEILPTNYDAQIYGMEVIEAPSERYEEIGGLEKQINEIREAVELPLKKPEVFRKMGIEPPKGVLLHGPPGTGKTLLARAVAHQTEAHFLRVVGSELVQKYIGEGARLVRELFELAKKKSPSIIFIDEIDAIGASRTESNTSGDREVHRTLMQLLAEMDGFSNRGDVRIIGATNRIDILDRALLRPGRFDRIIEIPAPDIEGRVSILNIHCAGMNIDKKVDIRDIATRTDGKNGADLRSICMEAGMFAIRSDHEMVTLEDFEQSIEKFSNDFERDSLINTSGAMFA
ncbi:proteasome-activating nucleotidase [Methanosphaerula palustris]|uniref:Proteasome-activating nucleotidase n=1 Tax=Methanosphaerula palustris (strain ATCC BAA-1556 / DSM 19958 / E1-9c) TaxID=521011 RepID=PAN_METPE|nr:proteasome-activating nucleotidase [Methanosphaerula palustris]B8GGN4.1 RecName: Full=Proteasome-activating nucleotidase; Short=PAN; AltName: Full=Proteasomal ATPase; AltName: Full=Proteasome regulatory ATPase; AltName: Full=Proteasome regulatory particle [Methanosphaerula palustris E1-9c]ACL16289.1 26S proteasome subunit P45 family [Methanosphaerula palustris E1-9c]